MPHTIWGRTDGYYTDNSPPSLASSVADKDYYQNAGDSVSCPQTPVKPRNGGASTLGFDLVEEAELRISAQNGTLLAEAASCTNSPKKAIDLAQRLAQQELTVEKIKTAVSSTASSVADGIASGINKTMEGHDAVEMLNTATNCISRICRFQQGTSTKPLASVPQRSSSSPPSFRSVEVPASLYQFVTFMAPKARVALSEQGIMTPGQVASREFGVYSWQIEQVLVRLFEQHQDLFCAEALMEMEPSWVPDPERKVWHLVLDAGVNTETSADPLIFETNMELPEGVDNVKVADYGRASQSQYEDEWENVEEMLEADEMSEMDQVGTLKTETIARMEKEEGITTTERNTAKPTMVVKTGSSRGNFFKAKLSKLW